MLILVRRSFRNTQRFCPKILQLREDQRWCFRLRLSFHSRWAPIGVGCEFLQLGVGLLLNLLGVEFNCGVY